MDRISPEDRSRLMAKVRGADTKIEILVRRIIWKEGFRYKKNQRVEGVRVDLVFPRSRLVIFVDGCFWHGCPMHYTVPSTRPDFWAEKIRGNVYRDRDQTLHLERKGWRVLRIWEHSIKADPERVAKKVCSLLVIGKGPPRNKDWRVVVVKHLASENASLWRLEDLRDASLFRNERRSGKGPKSTKGPKTT